MKIPIWHEVLIREFSLSLVAMVLRANHTCVSK